MDVLPPELLHMVQEYLPTLVWGKFRSVNGGTYELPLKREICRRKLQIEIRRSDIIYRINAQLAGFTTIRRCCVLCATGELVNDTHRCQSCSMRVCTHCLDKMLQMYSGVTRDKFRIRNEFNCCFCPGMITFDSLKRMKRNDEMCIINRINDQYCFNGNNYVKLCPECWDFNIRLHECDCCGTEVCVGCLRQVYRVAWLCKRCYSL